MRLSSALAIFLLFSFSSPQLPSGKDWRGLSPLKSTRADVEQSLGAPDVNAENKLLTYYLTQYVVYFEFSSNPQCKEKSLWSSWDVPADRVTVIRLTLKKPALVREAGLDLMKLTRRRASADLAEHYYYTNVDDGFSVEVLKEYITAFIYEPPANQQNLQCPGK